MSGGAAPYSGFRPFRIPIVIAELDPAIHSFRKKMDARVTSAFTRVFDALTQLFS
jgi:hypothetical protein